MPDEAPDHVVRLATPAEAGRIATLLDDFNVEFDTDTPGPAAIERRLSDLLAGDHTFCAVAGEPIVGSWVYSLAALLNGQIATIPQILVAGVQQARVLFATEKLVVDLAPGLSPDPITAAEVKAIRDSNPGRMMLYTTDELLKQHPMK